MATLPVVRAVRSRRSLVVAGAVGLALAAVSCGDSGPGPTPVVPQLSINCPPNAEGQSTDGGPAPVTFPPPASNGGSPPVTTTCSAQSGAFFPVGATTVTCQSTDSAGRSASCGFTVTVKPPPELRYTRFLAFGDSITWGVDRPPAVAPRLGLLAPDPPPFHAYPGQLQARLAAQYRRPSVSVLNAGIPAEFASKGGVQRFRSVLLTFTPEVVLLMEGTNDLLDGQAGADAAIASLNVMITEAQTQGRVIAIATIPPQRVGARRPVIPLMIPGFNERIRSLATSRNVVLVDVYNAMVGNMTLIGDDDLHPTVQGYQVIADTFFAAIKANFEQPQAAAASGLAR